MKLAKRLLGVDDIRKARANRPTASAQQVMDRIYGARKRLEEIVGPLEPDISPYAHRPGESPQEAHDRGVGYAGPNMEDKGQKDGSCNRTACQLPLAGKPQWMMLESLSGGQKLYYCGECARKFYEADRDFGRPFRCTLVVA